MAELKTKPTDVSVEAFLAGVTDEEKRNDSLVLLEMMREVTGLEPRMWGTGLVGFGTYHYVYKSGREGDWPLTAFSPRKTALSLYIMAGFERFEDLMSKLGKYKTGVGCLYIKRLRDVDRDVLRELVTRSVKHMKESSA